MTKFCEIWENVNIRNISCCQTGFRFFYLLLLSYNEDLLVKKCSSKTFFIHTPAWNTCPHSNFLTSSMLKPSWQMTQISSSSFGGCDSGFKHTQQYHSKSCSNKLSSLSKQKACKYLAS